MRFGIASALSTLCTLTALGLLLQASLARSWADLAACGAGTLITYALYRRWVWGVTHHGRLQDLGRCLVLAVASVAISSIAMLEVGILLAARHVAGEVRCASFQATDVAAFGGLAGLRLLLSQSPFRPRRPEV